MRVMVPHIHRIRQGGIRKRCFQTRADYEAWTRRMKSSRLLVANRSVALQRVNTEVAAPFLYSVSPISDRLLLFAATNNATATDGVGGDFKACPLSSMLECIYPLSGSGRDGERSIAPADLEIIRSSVSDMGSWSSFRLAKFYSDVDALTADVAYRHVRGAPRAEHVAFVTAGHFNSRKMHRTDLSRDLVLRCYPTSTGSASIEIRTDAVQMDEARDEEGKSIERLVNVCFTSMVAVDKGTLRPVKNVIPSIDMNGHNCPENELEKMKERSQMAEEHNKIRKLRVASSMHLRVPSSCPPTQAEMSAIHQIHQENSNIKNNMCRGEFEHSQLPTVEQHTFRSSLVVYPERRNVHGKLFGGFIMEQGHILAQYAADFFLNYYSNTTKADPSDSNRGCASESKRAIPLGLDEAIFLQPVSIGDHVTLTARVVHSTQRACRVVVTVEVRAPSDRHSTPLRSNRLSFLFGGEDFPSKIVPNTYSEILMHVDAQRRALVEGPMDEEVGRILHEAMMS